MKHRQNSKSRRLRPRFRQQQNTRTSKVKEAKKTPDPKKTLRTSHFHDSTYYILSIKIKVESPASINNSKNYINFIISICILCLILILIFLKK